MSDDNPRILERQTHTNMYATYIFFWVFFFLKFLGFLPAVIRSLIVSKISSGFYKGRIPS